MRFVLINEGQKAPLASQVTAVWLDQVAAACTIQLNRDLAPAWGGEYEVRVGSGPTDLAPGEIPFVIVDAIPTPDAVAEHSVEGNAQPFGDLGLVTCSTLDDVSSAVSHELCETAVDPDINAWRDDGQGKEWAQEASDGVEGNSYRINGIAVSDFLLPAFFAPQAPAPYSYTQATGAPGAYPAAPFATAAGGYQNVRNVGTGETQVDGEVPARRLARARHPSSRFYRRGGRV